MVNSKKYMVILVIIAVVLAITAISLRLTNSNEVPTSTEENAANFGDGKVGVTILPTNVEDKMLDDTGGAQA